MTNLQFLPPLSPLLEPMQIIYLLHYTELGKNQICAFQEEVKNAWLRYYGDWDK